MELLTYQVSMSVLGLSIYIDKPIIYRLYDICTTDRKEESLRRKRIKVESPGEAEVEALSRWST